MAREYGPYEPPGILPPYEKPITLQRSPIQIADVAGLTSRLQEDSDYKKATDIAIRELRMDVRGLKICVFTLLCLVGFLGITMFLLWAG